MASGHCCPHNIWVPGLCHLRRRRRLGGRVVSEDRRGFATAFGGCRSLAVHRRWQQRLWRSGGCGVSLGSWFASASHSVSLECCSSSASSLLLFPH